MIGLGRESFFLQQCCCQYCFWDLKTKTETWEKWTRVHSSLETLVSRSHSQHWFFAGAAQSSNLIVVNGSHYFLFSVLVHLIACDSSTFLSIPVDLCTDVTVFISVFLVPFVAFLLRHESDFDEVFGLLFGLYFIIFYLSHFCYAMYWWFHSAVNNFYSFFSQSPFVSSSLLPATACPFFGHACSWWPQHPA